MRRDAPYRLATADLEVGRYGGPSLTLGVLIRRRLAAAGHTGETPMLPNHQPF